MVRIKYYRDGTTSLFTKWITINPTLVVAVEIYFNHSYKIGTVDRKVLVTGQANSARQAKTIIRQLLISYGLILEGEIRNRK